MARVVIGILLIIIGLSYLLEINLWIYFWPALLILAGVYILMGRPGHWQSGHGDWMNRKHPPRWKEGKVEETSNGSVNISAAFQGVDRKVKTDDFKGGSINCVFSGVNLDLRGCEIKSKEVVVLKIDATLGGVKIMVPKNWEVQNDINSFAGGVHDSTEVVSAKDKTGTLHLIGQVTLGGIEIINF